MAPKGKKGKKGGDDWDDGLGESVDPVAQAEQEAKAADNAEEDEAGGCVDGADDCEYPEDPAPVGTLDDHAAEERALSSMLACLYSTPDMTRLSKTHQSRPKQRPQQIPPKHTRPLTRLKHITNRPSTIRNPHTPK